jgi:hypothetical protein
MQEPTSYTHRYSYISGNQTDIIILPGVMQTIKKIFYKDHVVRCRLRRRREAKPTPTESIL